MLLMNDEVVHQRGTEMESIFGLLGWVDWLLIIIICWHI